MDIAKITAAFVAKTGFMPVISAELEFYLDNNGEGIEKELEINKIETYGLERERGAGQYEIALKNPNTPETILNQIETIKKITKGDFRAKPFADRPGSGLHIHISLLNKEGKNIFMKPRGEEEETPEMAWAIGGLLDAMLKDFTLFAPNEDSYSRFTAEFNPQEPEEGRYNNAPVNVSWGGNNRTTAIRIPASSAYPDLRHIEHRVAGADADAGAVIAAILEAVQYGIVNKITPPAKTHGNAFDKQYAHLTPFPKTLEEAKKLSRR